MGLMFVGVPPRVIQQVGTTVAKDLLLERFKQVIAQRFGAQVATSVIVANLDSPVVPIADIFAAGIAAVTLIQIYQQWDELWNETVRQVQQEQPQRQTSGSMSVWR
jgi:hypothetical protein